MVLLLPEPHPGPPLDPKKSIVQKREHQIHTPVRPRRPSAPAPFRLCRPGHHLQHNLTHHLLNFGGVGAERVEPGLGRSQRCDAHPRRCSGLSGLSCPFSRCANGEYGNTAQHLTFSRCGSCSINVLPARGADRRLDPHQSAVLEGGPEDDPASQELQYQRVSVAWDHTHRDVRVSGTGSTAAWPAATSARSTLRPKPLMLRSWAHLGLAEEV